MPHKIDFLKLPTCELMCATEGISNVVYQLDKCIFTACFLRWVQLQEKELISFSDTSQELDSSLIFHCDPMSCVKYHNCSACLYGQDGDVTVAFTKPEEKEQLTFWLFDCLSKGQLFKCSPLSRLMTSGNADNTAFAVILQNRKEFLSVPCL